MSLSPEQIDSLARLARLHLSPDEKAALAEQLATIIGYVDQLQQVDTAGVEPIANVAGLVDVLREDVPGPVLPRETLLRLAPQADEEGFLVPQAVER